MDSSSYNGQRQRQSEIGKGRRVATARGGGGESEGLSLLERVMNE